MPSDRVNRLLQLITLLQTRTAWTADTLARELGVHKRTLYRDLNTLEEAGIPCREDAGGGYRIQRGFFLPPVSLTASEVLGLMQLIKSVGGHRDRPYHAQALSALYKLMATVPEPLRSTCAAMMAHVTIHPDAQLDGDIESRTFAQLQQAIDLSRACRVLYRSPVEDQPMQMEFEPYAMHHANRAWYVLGRTDLHNEVRVLKLLRIEELTMLTRVFGRPPSFSIAQKLGNCWRLIPEGREYAIELEFSAKVATNVAEVRWHHSQEQEMLDDGRCRMRFQVDGLNEIAWWVCGYADQVVVRKPKKLAEIVCRMLQSGAALYDEPEWA